MGSVASVGIKQPGEEAVSGDAAPASDLLNQYVAVRQRSAELASPLSAEDQTIQSMDDVSPTKWHLAHTTWFFETFILGEYEAAYQPFHPHYGYLFNSYYNAIGERHPRAKRGLLSRPALAEIHDYRRHVDEAMSSLLCDPTEEIESLVVLGLHHEQQHQELMLTDIKHVLSCNSLMPEYQPADVTLCPPNKKGWMAHSGGLVEIGADGSTGGFDGFSFDNEGPNHKVWLEPFQMAIQLVTNGDYLNFMEDGGYNRPEFWLSEGWATVNQENWQAPLYWDQATDGNWKAFTLHGQVSLDLNSPACHISHFEADAYARWAGSRLPTEAEWEVLARGPSSDTLQDLYGTVWQWTSSAYAPYPRYRAAAGAVGEYNGKFMNSQMVLRGSSLATAAGHARPTYRNFFYSGDRWQFTGLRLAEDI
jgi:ergothioneine biosynthesis protein EgtB